MPECIPIFVFTDSIASSYGYSNHGSDHAFNDARRNSVFSYSCPYCLQDCKCESEETRYGVTGWVTNKFTCCFRCGWWSFESDSDSTDGNPTYESMAAIMKKFDCDSPDLPIDPLVAYIKKNHDLIYQINPSKLEELVGAIFTEVLGYKVEYCSYARPDKGIDLIVVNMEGRTSAIQVKRYKRPIEIGMIHQFLGALIDNNRREGIFVTTSRFRSGAISTATSLKEKANVTIDLINGRQLLEFIGVMNSSPIKIPRADEFSFWRSHPYFGEK